MGFRARKSFKVIPGVRMTVSKSGVSTSVGGKGYRVTRTASGRTTRTVALPGTGVSHTTTTSSSSARGGSSAARPPGGPPATPPPAKPRFTAPRWEKDLFAAVSKGKHEDLARIGRSAPEAAPVTSALEGFLAFQAEHRERATELLDWTWRYGGLIEEHPFVQRYLASSAVALQVAQGVTATLPLCRDAVGLALAELYQEADRLDTAIGVVEELDPSLVAAVSLGELYLAAGRYDDVIGLTDGITNHGDETALLLTFRGAALREQGHFSASREALKQALRSTKTDASIRHLALLERAATYRAEGKLAMARRDLEKILAEDAAFPGVQEALNAL